MEEKVKKEIKEIIGDKHHRKYQIKSMNIIDDGKQMSVRIPKKLAEQIKLDKDKHEVEFKLIPLENGKFKIQAEIKEKE